MDYGLILEKQNSENKNKSSHFVLQDPLEKKRNKNRSNGSGSKNPESSDPQEVDLELKLSL